MCFLINKYCRYISVLIIISIYNTLVCEANYNTSYIPSLRDYSVYNTSNSSHVKTLQKEESGRKVYILPASNPIKFKENQDNELSSSSHSRGLLIHEHPGYSLHDYEESPHYEYGHDYPFYDTHHSPHGPHGYDHYGNEHHYYVGHHDYGKGYYKYHNHALATKAALWPLAGIALLGAAAALVTNPVLLQLGVISGKRKRRDTEEENTGPDIPLDAYINYTEKNKYHNQENYVKSHNLNNNGQRRILKTNRVKIKNFKNVKKIKSVRSNNIVEPATLINGFASKPYVDLTTYTPNLDKTHNEDTFIPIPIMLGKPKISRN